MPQKMNACRRGHPWEGNEVKVHGRRTCKICKQAVAREYGKENRKRSEYDRARYLAKKREAARKHSQETHPAVLLCRSDLARIEAKRAERWAEIHAEVARRNAAAIRPYDILIALRGEAA